MTPDYYDDGVRANSVLVGSVDTVLTAEHAEALSGTGVTTTASAGRIGRTAEPSEVAEAALFLASDLA